MRRMVTASLYLAVVVVLGAATLGAGCSQDEGDYCQLNRDCKDGLICVRATNTCQVSSSTAVDAGADAAAVDAD